MTNQGGGDLPKRGPVSFDDLLKDPPKAAGVSFDDLLKPPPDPSFQQAPSMGGGAGPEQPPGGFDAGQPWQTPSTGQGTPQGGVGGPSAPGGDRAQAAFERAFPKALTAPKQHPPSEVPPPLTGEEPMRLPTEQEQEQIDVVGKQLAPARKMLAQEQYGSDIDKEAIGRLRALAQEGQSIPEGVFAQPPPVVEDTQFPQPDMRWSKVQRDFRDFVERNGGMDPKLQFGLQEQEERKAKGGWSDRHELDWNLAAMKHQEDVLLGRMIALSEAADSGEDVTEGLADVRAGMEYINGKRMEVVGAQKDKLRERLLEGAQDEANARAESGDATMLGQTAQRALEGGIRGSYNIATGIAKAIDFIEPFDTGKYTWSERFFDWVSDGLEMRDAHIPDQFKGPIIGRDDDGKFTIENPSAILPTLADVGTNMLLMIGGGAAGGARGLVATAMSMEHEEFMRSALEAGVNPDVAEAYAIPYSAVAATIELVNPQLYFSSASTRSALHSSLLSSIKKGVEPTKAVKVAFAAGREGGQEVVEETLQMGAENLAQRAINYAEDQQYFDTSVSPEEFLETVGIAFTLGSLAGGTARALRKSPARAEAMGYAIANPETMFEAIRTLPQEQQQQAAETFETFRKTYATLPEDLSAQQKYEAAELIREKGAIQQEQKEAPADEAVVEAVGDPRDARIAAINEEIKAVVAPTETDMERAERERAAIAPVSPPKGSDAFEAFRNARLEEIRQEERAALVTSLKGHVVEYAGEYGYIDIDEGGKVTFENVDGTRVFEIGTKEDLSEIANAQLVDVENIVNEDGSVSVMGRTFRGELLPDPVLDENGDIYSVEMQLEDGGVHTFYGDVAAQVIYENGLREARANPDLLAQIETNLTTDEDIRRTIEQERTKEKRRIAKRKRKGRKRPRGVASEGKGKDTAVRDEQGWTKEEADEIAALIEQEELDTIEQRMDEFHADNKKHFKVGPNGERILKGNAPNAVKRQWADMRDTLGYKNLLAAERTAVADAAPKPKDAEAETTAQPATPADAPVQPPDEAPDTAQEPVTTKQDGATAQTEADVSRLEGEASKEEERPGSGPSAVIAAAERPEGIVSLRVASISTDEARFQNRDKLDEAHVKRIADNFDENNFDPIVVWTDPKNGRAYVLAGHHRLAAAKMAGRKAVPSRVFNGTEAEAIQYAKGLSNANRLLESPVERAKYYRDRLAAGEKKSVVEKEAEQEGKNKSFVLNVAALNENGPIIAAMRALEASEDKATQKELERMADWVGSVRRNNPDLTDAHEQEMYRFLMDADVSKRIKTKTDFQQKVHAVAGAMDFDASQPLNLARFKHQTQGEQVYNEEVSNLKEEIASRQKQVDDLKGRFSDPQRADYVPTEGAGYAEKKMLADEKVAALNAEIRTWQGKLQDLYRNKGKYMRGGEGQGDLFGEGASAAPSKGVAPPATKPTPEEPTGRDAGVGEVEITKGRVGFKTKKLADAFASRMGNWIVRKEGKSWVAIDNSSADFEAESAQAEAESSKEEAAAANAEFEARQEAFLKQYPEAEADLMRVEEKIASGSPLTAKEVAIANDNIFRPSGYDFDETGSFVKAKAIEPKTKEQADAIDKAYKSASRFKPSKRVEFGSPITGPSGARLTAYEWKYKFEEYTDSRGEDRVKRVSDWDMAELSDETGRDIVHQFEVVDENGRGSLVSAESALKIMGYLGGAQAKDAKSMMSAAKTLAGYLMQLDGLRAELQIENDAKAKVAKMPRPEVVIKSESDEARGLAKQRKNETWSMGDAQVWVMYPEDGTLSSYDREERLKTLEWSWEHSEMRKLGVDPNARPAQKIAELERKIATKERQLGGKAVDTPPRLAPSAAELPQPAKKKPTPKPPKGETKETPPKVKEPQEEVKPAAKASPLMRDKPADKVEKATALEGATAKRAPYALPGFEGVNTVMVKDDRGWRPNIILPDGTALTLTGEGTQQRTPALAASEGLRILNKHGLEKVEALAKAIQAAKGPVMEQRPFRSDDADAIGFNYTTDQVARERFDLPSLNKVGSGSDRDVYDLGGGKVLKVAKTARGLEQNMYESDPIDFIPNSHERGLNYVVVDKVDPAKSSDVVTYEGYDGEEGTTTIGEMLKDLSRFSQKDADEHTGPFQEAVNKYGFNDAMNYNVIWNDFIAKRNWGVKDGAAVHLDGGTFGGVRMLNEYRGKKNLDDADFREIYNRSRRAKKEFGDKDRATMYQAPSDGTPASRSKISDKDVANMVKALAGIFPNATVVQPKTPKEYADALKNVGKSGIEASWGLVDFATQTIYVNPASPNKRQTLFHEGAHPVLYALAIARPDLINQFAEELATTKGGEKYVKYGERYSEKPLIERQQEMLAQLLGDVTSGAIPVSTKKDSLYQKFKQFIQDVLAALGWDMRTVDLSKPQNVRDFAREFKRAMDKGIKITGLPEVGGKDAKTMLQDDAQRLVDGWYSRLRETVIAKGKTLPASEWLNWMQSRAKEGAFSVEEAKWTGLQDWLAGKGKEKVTPQQVREFLDENRVRVEVVEKGLKQGHSGKSWTQEELDRLEDTARRTQNWVAFERAQEEYEAQELGTDDTKFGQYQLPGGTNYREVLVTLPNEKKRRHQQLYDFIKDRSLTREELDEFDALTSELQSTGSFTSSHFDEPNILFHLRLNDRTDADGKKVLFIEEVQSDWAQKGRKEGFKSDGKYVPPSVGKFEDGWSVASPSGEQWSTLTYPSKEELLADHKLMWKREQQFMYDPSAYSAEKVPSGVLVNGEPTEEVWQVKRKMARPHGKVGVVNVVREPYADNESEAISKAIERKRQEAVKGTPSAPFVTDTSAWVELAIKQAVRMAVEGNYDRVAWTTGEQQNERYDLSKEVESISWKNHDSRRFGTVKTVTIEPTDGGTLQLMDIDVDEKGEVVSVDNGAGDLLGKRLDDVVGKEIADKIMADETGDLSGDGLKIGGTGMKGFYDKIVPTVAAKVIKKMGGGKVGETSIGTADKKGDGYNVVTPEGDYLAGPFATQAEAQKHIDTSGVPDKYGKIQASQSPQPSFDITPAMKEQVGLGLALMQKPDPAKVKNMADALRGMDITTAEEVTSRMKSFGLSDTITDAVLKEMGLPTMGEAQKKVKQATGQRTMPVQPQEVKTVKDAVRLAAQSVMKGYRQGVAEGQLGGEIAGKRAGRKEGRTDAKAEAERRRKEFAAQTKETLKDLYGKLTPAQAKSLTTRAIATDPMNPKAVSRFGDYVAKVMENANYSADVDATKALQDKAKRILKRDGIPSNHQEILSRIKDINPEALDNPAEFAALAGDYLRTFSSPSTVKYQMGSTTAMDAALSKYEKQQVAEFERMLADEFGVEADGVDAKALYEALMENPNMGDPANPIQEMLTPDQKRTVAEKMAEQAAYSQMGLMDVDLQQFTPAERKIIVPLQNVDTSKIPASKLPEFIRYVDNITVNGSLAGAKPIAAMARAINSNDNYRKNRDLSKIRQVWDSKLGKIVQEQFSSVSGTFRFLKGSTNEASELIYHLGVHNINKEKAQLDADLRKVAKGLNDALKKAGKKNSRANSAKNRAVEGGISWVLQRIPGLSLDESFRANKDMVLQSIERSGKYANMQKETAAAMEFYEELLEGSSTVEQFIDAVQEKYPENWAVLGHMMDTGKLFQDEVLDHGEQMWNEAPVNRDDPYYMPKITKRLKGEKLKVDDNDFVRFAQSKGVGKPKQAGSLKGRIKMTSLPEGRVIDFNIRSGFLRNLKENLYDTRTSEHWAHVNHFLELDGSEEIFGSLDNRDFVAKRLGRLYKAQRGDIVIEGVVERLLDAIASFGRRAAAGYALGGITQIPKQAVDQLLNASINTDPVSVGRMLLDVYKADDFLSLGAIGERGELMGGTRWNNDLESKVSRLGEALQNENIAKVREAIKDLNNLWLAPLRHSDVAAARAAFLSFYQQELERKGHELGSWQDEANLVMNDDEVRNKAFAYAEMMTDLTQGSSDPSKLAMASQRTESGLLNLVKALINPFSTFSVSIRERIINDISDIKHYGALSASDAEAARTYDKAVRSLAATTASQAAFNIVRIYVAKAMITGGAQGLLAIVSAMKDDDDDREEMMDDIALAFEVLYTARLMDTDAYRAAMEAQKKQAKMTALGPEYDEEREKKRDAEFKWKMAYSSFLRDMLAGGMTSFAEDGVIDAMNLLYYEGGLIMGFEDFRDKDGNPVKYKQWLTGKDTPFYRYGQGREGVRLGVFDVIGDRVDKPYEAAKRVLRSDSEKRSERYDKLIREYKDRADEHHKTRDKLAKRFLEAETAPEVRVVLEDLKAWRDELREKNVTEGEISSMVRMVSNAKKDQHLDPWLREIKNISNVKVRAVEVYRAVKNAKSPEEKARIIALAGSTQDGKPILASKQFEEELMRLVKEHGAP